MRSDLLTPLCLTLALSATASCTDPAAKRPPEREKGAVDTPAPAPTPAVPGGLTPAERQELYHLPEGGELLPLDILRAVDSVRTFKPFMEGLERFRLIPDPADPDGLPVGMSAAMSHGQRSEPRMVFFNCAACHTADISYRGQRLRVDGAPAHFDMAGFIVELLQSLDSTVVDPQRLAAFAKRLQPPQPPAMAKVGQQLQSAVELTRLLSAKIAYVQRLRGLRPTTLAGFGRLDAFVAARNLLFGPATAIDVNSPVSLPPIFGLSRLSWFHYDNNTNSILQRNLGEDLGVGCVADLSSGESTAQLRNLVRLESLAAKLPLPKWPEALLGRIDRSRSERGAQLYKKECAACHDSSASGPFPDRVVALDEIGTDGNRARNFAKPVGDQPFAAALASAIGKVEKRAFQHEGFSAAEIAALEPQPAIWRTTLGYGSRPLDGVWATAPYLHNGSVPTLADLLLPPAERPKRFLTGSREFDPQKVGYVTDGAADATFLIDTAADGNHNSGHRYGTTLSADQRLDLLEYLKSR